jgi:hypothetical protein
LKADVVLEKGLSGVGMTAGIGTRICGVHAGCRGKLGVHPADARQGNAASPSGRAGMTAAEKKILLTIGAFDAEQHAPWPAAAHLLSLGFTQDQLSLAAMAPAMDKAVSPGVMGDLEKRVAPLLARLGVIDVGCEVGALVATSGPMCVILCCRDHEHAGSPTGHERSSARLRSDLLRHIERGAVLLGVNAADASQQLISARVLLQHSPHGVQSHEFADKAH